MPATEQATHTPGPWMIPSGMSRVISEGSWHTIAQCGPDGAAHWTLSDPAVVSANARLIAVAPELLGHLKFAVKMLSALPGFSGTAQVEAMQAVIAAAEA